MMFELRWVWKNLTGKKPYFVAGILLSVLTMTMMIFIPMLSALLVDEVIRGGRVDLLVPVLLGMCGVQLLRTVLRYLMVYCLEIASQHTIMRLRNHIFDTIVHQELHFYDRNRTGDIITRVTGDMEYVRHAVAWISYSFTDALSLFLATVIYLSTVHMGLTLMMLAVMPIIAIISVAYTKKIRPVYAELRECLSRLNTAAQENIAGNRVVKAFAREDYEIERFDRFSRDFKAANLKAAYRWQTVAPVIEFLSNALTVIMVLCGGLFIINGSLTLGGLTAFSGLTASLANPMKSFGTILNDMQRFFTAADKVIEIYYSKPTIADRHDCVVKPGRIAGKITFRDVTFSYDREPVLKHLNFTIQPGESIAIMGPTGSGKTSLINLIPRFYDVQEGAVLVDDVDVRMLRLEDLRGSIGLATQDVFLFSDTVDGNIAYGDPNLPESKVFSFARKAAAADFIEQMEEGYDTIVGERGVGLSGGQRQRIALARALAISPPILILDDTTSAVDMETEHYIQESLRSLDFPCTKIIVAQRISSVRDADRIFIMQNGELTVGTHESLSKTNAYYREICRLQNVPVPEMAERGAD
ncbi:MAG: ABC transporter ATP-binding protein [Candidatus Howiella sp.]|jgi:ATP-binding cassette subfamily B multidrug efflux pump